MRNLTILFLLLIQHPALTQSDAGIIYGKNHAFSLTAPEGWILDNHSGVNQGLHAVFYETGQTWKDAPTVMYANTASLEAEGQKTLTELINFDVENFRKQFPGINITDAPDIQIGKVVAKIKHLSGGSYTNHEATAYIDAGKTGIIIVLSARTKEAFQTALPAFDKLVKSYVFITDRVEEEKKD